MSRRDVLRYVAIAAAASAVIALVIGLPTDVIPNPWFRRMTPVRPLDAIYLPIISILTGALLATAVLPARCPIGRPGRVGLVSGGFGWLAIGCPMCNKLVVAAVAVSGALQVFAPLQPALGALAIALASIALVMRVRAVGLWPRSSVVASAPP